MTRKKKQREDRRPRRKLHFERPYGVKLEDLLELYMHIVGEMDAELDMKIDKITISLEGNRTELEKTVSELQILQGQLIGATTADENGNYSYEQGLFLHIFKSQIQTQFLTQVIAANNYHSELTEGKTIISNIPLYELKQLQAESYKSINEAPTDQHKDIQKFVSIVSMKTGKLHDEILQLGIANELFTQKDDKLHFANSQEKVMEQIIEIINELSSGTSEEVDSLVTDDENLGGFGFDGGKIVFVNASERSPFEDQEKNQEQQE